MNLIQNHERVVLQLGAAKRFTLGAGEPLQREIAPRLVTKVLPREVVLGFRP